MARRLKSFDHLAAAIEAHLTEALMDLCSWLSRLSLRRKPHHRPGATTSNRKCAMTQLYALKLTKSQLKQIPADESLFYFLAGQLENDINILTKFLTIAINEVRIVEPGSPMRSAALSQVVLLLKLTAL
jgi:hypothetical protein